MDTDFFSNKTPSDIHLKNENVDIWCIPLKMNEFKMNTFLKSLSDDEREKAGRLRFNHVKEAFIASRGLLRLILSTYLNIKPQDLEFRYGEHGKPFIQDGFGHGGLTFNMSHSHGMALYGVGLNRSVGVDIEKIRSDMSFENIAKRFFSPPEYEALLKLPPDQIETAFFRCWTRKEAYIKAKGAALSSSIKHFSVSLAPGEPAALLEHQLDAAEVTRWSILDLDVGPDYAAALSVDGHDVTITKKAL